ncbi:O-antigen/teichoic acid export membrane protein [Paraburkholderia sp. RAU2J]|uniref:lipopolysaccharide biosynthesis protein n=1 Tax=Paraburkholderia sp. RAU2J TaxID=1938810 RepID=UPI000EAF636B|nr:oligosaccharide flippase family protein [Paraburkholderia sp. RAU2J]RKT10541.1 O-antigen/teichoic acid export membrane protein [Paraburkholderia sp. RAU2J]
MTQSRFAHIAASLPPNAMVRRIASSFLSRVLGAVANLAFVIYLGRYLGAAQTGIYMIGLGAATLLSTIGRLGLEQIVIREGGPLVRDSQWHALRCLYRRALTLSLCVSIAIAALLLLINNPLAHYVFHQDSLGDVMPWFAASIIPLAYALMHVPFLQIIHRPEGSIAVLSLWIPLVSLPLILLIHPQTGVQGAQIYLVACVFNAAFAYAQWRSFIACRSGHSNEEQAVQPSPLLAAAVPLLIGNVGQIALLWIAVFAVGISASPRAVGAYSIAQRVALTLSGFLLPPIDALVGPRIAVMRGIKTRDEIEEMVRRISSLLFIVAAVVFALILLFGREILKLFGNEFGEGYGALVCLTFGQLVIVASGSIRPLLVVHGMEKAIRNAMVGAATCCIVLCFLLLPYIGPLGAAIATSLALAGEKIIEGVVARRRLGILVFPSVALYALHVRTWLARNHGQRS